MNNIRHKRSYYIHTHTVYRVCVCVGYVTRVAMESESRGLLPFQAKKAETWSIQGCVRRWMKTETQTIMQSDIAQLFSIVTYESRAPTPISPCGRAAPLRNNTRGTARSQSSIIIIIIHNAIVHPPIELTPLTNSIFVLFYVPNSAAAMLRDTDGLDFQFWGSSTWTGSRQQFPPG
jgi:hypothetical protein